MTQLAVGSIDLVICLWWNYVKRYGKCVTSLLRLLSMSLIPSCCSNWRKGNTVGTSLCHGPWLSTQPRTLRWSFYAAQPIHQKYWSTHENIKQMFLIILYLYIFWYEIVITQQCRVAAVQPILDSHPTIKIKQSVIPLTNFRPR